MAEVKTIFIERLPYKPFRSTQKINYLVHQIRQTSKELLERQTKFQSYLASKFEIEKFSTKLQSWHELEFGEFIKELNKALKASNKGRIKVGLSPVAQLTKKDEFEWMELFEENKQKAMELQREIEKTDKEIDQMAYELYGLTEEEIGIVEDSMK